MAAMFAGVALVNQIVGSAAPEPKSVVRPQGLERLFLTEAVVSSSGNSTSETRSIPSHANVALCPLKADLKMLPSVRLNQNQPGWLGALQDFVILIFKSSPLVRG
jgi:hypothetical protein